MRGFVRALGLAVLLLAGALLALPAHASGILQIGRIGGALFSLAGGALMISGTKVMTRGTHANGFGDSVEIFAFDPSLVSAAELPECGGSLVYSNTLSSGGSSSAHVGGCWSQAVPNRFDVVPDLGNITLTHTDDDNDSTNNGPASLEVALLVPWHLTSNGTVTGASTVDILSNVSAFGANDFFRVDHCLFEVAGGGSLDPALAFLSDPGSCLAQSGALRHDDATLGPGTPMPQLGASASVTITAASGKDFVSAVLVQMQIQNDTTELRLEDIELGLTAVPEPATGLLVALGVAGLAGTRARSSRRSR